MAAAVRLTDRLAARKMVRPKGGDLHQARGGGHGSPVTRFRSLEPAHRFLLGVLGTAAFFDGYDFYIVTVALPQIRRTFGLTQAQASLWIGVLYLGAIPAIFITRRADLHGRRRLLIFSVLGYTVATAATALAPTIAIFASCQFVARLFLHSEDALVWTMVAEELPADARGLGFGWLAMLNALGSGLGAIIYGSVLAPLGISWRFLYAAAIPPLLLIAFLRRRLPESRRFVVARDSGRLESRWQAILRRPHRRWLFLVCITAALGALTTQAGAFVIDFMQTNRGMSPASANLVLVAAGALGIPVLLSAGSLSDRFGRKWVGCSFALLAVVGGFSFFILARGAPFLFLTLAVSFIGQFGAWPTLGAFGTELFPTSLRALAGSWATIFRVSGQFMSFVLGSVLIVAAGGLSRAAVILSAGPLLTIGIIAIWFPETKGRELEEISGEPLLVIAPSGIPMTVPEGAAMVTPLEEEPAD